jgi:hypothetical protein
MVATVLCRVFFVRVKIDSLSRAWSFVDGWHGGICLCGVWWDMVTLGGVSRTGVFGQCLLDRFWVAWRADDEMCLSTDWFLWRLPRELTARRCRAARRIRVVGCVFAVSFTTAICITGTVSLPIVVVGLECVSIDTRYWSCEDSQILDHPARDSSRRRQPQSLRDLSEQVLQDREFRAAKPSRGVLLEEGI